MVWTRETHVEQLTADKDVLVVLTAAGGGGAYADWWQGGHGGQPAWETFHTQELPQLLERNWQAGDKRAIGGSSMGGLGALDYAARHPGLFQAVASFSGVADNGDPQDQMDPAVWGDKTAQADIWRAHSPLQLADKLKGADLYISYGNGIPGPLDDAQAEHDDFEALIAAKNERLVARLKELGIPATVDAYGPGTHSWPYWDRELPKALPMLLKAIGE